MTAGSVPVRRFELIEGLRALATLWVFGAHVLALAVAGTGGLRADLAIGPSLASIAIFFSISGFVLYRPFVRLRGRRSLSGELPRFALRRVARIAPAYWVAITALAVFPGLPGIFGENWWTYYGLLQVYSEEWHHGGGLGPAWTLCAEASFYVALPVLAVVLHRRGACSGRPGGLRTELALLGGLATASLLFHGFALDAGRPVLSYTLLGIFPWAAVGMMLAAISAQPEECRAQRAVAWVGRRPLAAWCAAAALLAVFVVHPLPGQEQRRLAHGIVEGLGFAVVAGLLLLTAVYGERSRLLRRTLGHPVMAWLAQVSYGIYLYHEPLVRWLNGTQAIQASPAPLLTLVVLSAAATIACATASWYLLERPILRAVGSTRTRTAGPAPPAGAPSLSRA